MKKLILSVIYLFPVIGAIAQSAVLNVKSSEKAKDEPAVTYFLPQTVLEIEVEAAKTIRKAGPFVFEAQKYLGVPAEIQRDESIWTIREIRVRQKSEPDAGNQFRVYASSSSNATLLSLTETGILKGINLPVSFLLSTKGDSCPDFQTKRKEEEKAKKIKKNFLANFSINDDDSIEKRSNAEAAFEQIISLREARLNILSQNDEVLQDAHAIETYLQEIEKQEKELIALFDGWEEKETVRKIFTVYPDKEITNQDLFRFSERQGFAESGYAITISLKKRHNNNKPVFSGKGKTGFAYRLPALTDIEIIQNGTTLWKGEANIAQLGKPAYLPAGLFDKNDVKALFDTKSGALLQLMK